MRTRSKSYPQYSIRYRRWPANTPPFYGGIQTTTTLSVHKQYESTITDDPVKGAYEKPCSHVWTSFIVSVPPEQVLDVPFEWKTNRPFRPAIESTSGHGWSTAMKGPEWGNTSAALLEDYATDALRQMWPSVNEGLSVINFLLELKDLKRMFQLWRNKEKFQRAVKRTSFNDEAIRGVAALNLNWQFGWKPFISDVMEMMSSLTGLDRKIKWLARNSGKVLKRNYRKNLTTALPYSSKTVAVNYGPWIDDIVPNNTNYQTISTVTPRWVASPTYHATLIYRFQLPKYLNEWSLKVRALRDAFGVKLDPSILWNAIPFSFVIDWFLKVGDFLQSFSPNDLDMQVEVLDFSASLKYHMITECSARFTKPGFTTDEFRVYSYERSYYERRRFIPNLHRLSVSVPGFMQGFLGGSLVLANSSRGPKRKTVRKLRPSRVW